MDATTNHGASSPLANVSVHSGGPESEFNKSSGISRRTSAGGESTGEIITNFELDIACICEKLTNLNLLSMHVETKESGLEPFAADMDPDLCVKALEFDLLSGFLDSELKILETHICDLQTYRTNIQEHLSSRKQLAESLIGMEDMLRDSERSLEQSLAQVTEIKIRSSDFQRNLLRFSGEETYPAESSNNEYLPELKMQTVEHKRHILRMLGKSLERELDLEKRVTELTQLEETLTMKLDTSEFLALFLEEESENTLDKLYQADHTSAILMEISKELLTEIKMLQFNLRGSVQREAELKNSLVELEKVKESELSDIKVRLQHVEACYEASQEDKSMLNSMIKDMGNVIDDLKKKVSEAEIQTESVEDKCVFLSESNAELKKELGFARGRVKCLEASLNQTDQIKKATAKDISLHTKLIKDLVMQMALERERLQKQMSSLKQENKILVKRLKKTDKDPANKVKHDDKVGTTDSGLSETSAGPTESASEIQTMRNIDARELKPKYILLLFVLLIVPLFGLLFH